MKRLLAVVLGTVALCAAGVGLAQDVTAPAPGPTATSPASMTGMQGQMDAHMQAMQALRDQTANAGTFGERPTAFGGQWNEMPGCTGMTSAMMRGSAAMGGTGGGVMGRGRPVDADGRKPRAQTPMNMTQMMMQVLADRAGMAGARALDAVPR